MVLGKTCDTRRKYSMYRAIYHAPKEHHKRYSGLCCHAGCVVHELFSTCCVHPKCRISVSGVIRLGLLMTSIFECVPELFASLWLCVVLEPMHAQFSAFPRPARLLSPPGSITTLASRSSVPLHACQKPGVPGQSHQPCACPTACSGTQPLMQNSALKAASQQDAVRVQQLVDTDTQLQATIA